MCHYVKTCLNRRNRWSKLVTVVVVGEQVSFQVSSESRLNNEWQTVSDLRSS